jgi:hypothetical protein
MLDRGIGILGIALAIIFGVWSLAPEGWPKMPPWASITGVGVGILLVGLAAGLIIGDYRQSDVNQLVDAATLRLHIYADDGTPQRLSYNNIWRWFYLRTLLIGVDKDTGKAQQHNVMATLFVTFETPVKVGTLEFSSADIRLPLHEVKEFNNRFAIIVFLQAPTEGTLDISVHP